MSRRWIALGLFLLSAAFYVHDAAPAATPGDAGEFIAAAATLSLPHSPSFPLYVLSAHGFLSLVPLGSPAYRTVLFSAVCAAAAVAVFFLALDVATRRRWASIAPALALAVSPPFWMNALVAEVFALHALLIAALFYVLAATARGETDPARGAVLFGFLGGVAATNHQAVLFVAPAYLAFAWFVTPRQRLLHTTLVAAAFFLLGLSLFLTLPIRSAQNPPLNWGRPTSVERFYRTITRKDYGTMTLALGGAPERSAANSARQLLRFKDRLAYEAGWPLVLAGLAGLALGLRRRDPLSAAALAAFLASGPLFFLLGNLPFDAQSEGIVLRFYIAPVLALVLGTAGLVERWPRLGAATLGAACLLMLFTRRPEAAAHRGHMLVPDYARAMLRAVPHGGALFLDGGDDAFYGLATELYAHGRRPDLVVHDRGGLVFANPYGSDFRALSKTAKEARRQQVEAAFLSRGPLFYATMHQDILPGHRMTPRAFLHEIDGGPAGFDWPLAILRSVYPQPTDDFRTRALAAFFPYMRGMQRLAAAPEDAFGYFRRAALIGGLAPWLLANLEHVYETAGHRWLVEEKWPLARRAYLEWVDYNGGAEAAFNNLGVVCERMGRLEEAAKWYRVSAERYPDGADSVYNLAVLAWNGGDWKAAAGHFEEALRRRPDHPSAGRFLAQARERAR